MFGEFEVVVAAGSLRCSEPAVTFGHRWTEEGVTVESEFTGAHLLHVAVAGCVLNDMYREAPALGIRLDGVRVSAAGTFSDSWESTGVKYRVEVRSPASSAAIEQLLGAVDAVAEIPRAIRTGAPVRRIP